MTTLNATARWTARILLTLGLLAFALTGLSVVDLFLPRPYDGVVLESDAPGQLVVRSVVPGSGAERAGIRAGYRIVGIDRTILKSPVEAAVFLNEHRIGDKLPYLVETSRGRREFMVELGPRRIGNWIYVCAYLLGFAFFVVGLFVLLSQPELRAGHVFFVLSTLFMLFLVCRLRPASYSRLDTIVLEAGTLALLFLPGTFLHFFTIFPRPAWRGWKGLPRRLMIHPLYSKIIFTVLYLLPMVAYLWNLRRCQLRGEAVTFISGVPISSWWTLAGYSAAGFGILALNSRSLKRENEQRGARLVGAGIIFGLLPFLITAIGFPETLHTTTFLITGIAPLLMIPLTFAYAIFRFQLLNIRVMLRKSLMYTLTTALVTGLYAFAIALFNSVSRDSPLAESPYFPLVFALTIVLGFEPLRKRLQGPVDRFFFAEKARLQQAVVEMGRAFAAQVDLAQVVRDLVERLPKQLRLHYAALYLLRGEHLVRVAGPSSLPESFPYAPPLHRRLRRQGGLARIGDLDSVRTVNPQANHLLQALEAAEAAVLVDLSSPRRHLGLAVLSGKSDRLAVDNRELELLRNLFDQATIGLENTMLIEEMTEQAEFERELEIASGIQASLLPEMVNFAPGWTVAAACHPARVIGGDFFVELPTNLGHCALAYGDVSGKSVPGALLMMAAHEVLHSLSMVHREPADLLKLANRRLYQLRRRSFVALGYLASTECGTGLRYSLAGQPQLLRRKVNAFVEELPLPCSRLPLGAMAATQYDLLETPVHHGELVLGCSDGILEAQSPQGEFFGEARLMEAIARGPAEPQPAVDHILGTLNQFTGGQEPYDDLTLIALSRTMEVC